MNNHPTGGLPRIRTNGKIAVWNRTKCGDQNSYTPQGYKVNRGQQDGTGQTKTETSEESAFCPGVSNVHLQFSQEKYPLYWF